MPNFLRSAASLCVLSGSLLVAPRPTVAQPSAPELILYNGKIFTTNVDHPYVQALAIHGDRILATGDSAKILALRGPGTRTIDLGGRTAIPGINDAHVHLDIESTNEVNLPIDSENRTGVNPTFEQVMAAITASVKKADSKSVLTAAVGPAIYFDPRMTRSALDSVAPNNPVMLTTFTGHAAFLNSAALRQFGIREDQPDPMGGKYERGADGKLDGVVREYALFDLERQIADGVSDTDALEQLRAQLNQAAKFGITTIQDMSNGMPPARAVALLEKLPPTTRVRVMRMPGTTVAGRDVKEGRPAPRPDSPLITVSGTKWMLDGTPLEGTFESREERAADFNPGSGKSMEAIFANFGMLFPEPELTAMLLETQHDNDPLLLHISGYISASAMLKALQSNGGSEVWSTRRVRFEHGDGLYPEFIPTLKALGIIVVQNPTHLAAGGMIAGLKLERAQPLRSLLDAGIPVALGSDGPMNPYLNIMLASIDPDRPKEAMTREQAVIAYTLTSACAEFREKDKGTLEPNKLADVAVLSQDIFSVPPPDLPKTTSVLTIVGGKVVYDSKVLSSQ